MILASQHDINLYTTLIVFCVKVVLQNEIKHLQQCDTCKSHDATYFLQCVVDLDTQEPTDELTPEAVQLISALGSTANKISEVLDNQDRAVFTAIQEGIDRANEKAVSRAQKVNIIYIRLQYMKRSAKTYSLCRFLNLL